MVYRRNFSHRVLYIPQLLLQINVRKFILNFFLFLFLLITLLLFLVLSRLRLHNFRLDNLRNLASFIGQILLQFLVLFFQLIRLFFLNRLIIIIIILIIIKIFILPLLLIIILGSESIRLLFMILGDPIPIFIILYMLSEHVEVVCSLYQLIFEVLRDNCIQILRRQFRLSYIGLLFLSYSRLKLLGKLPLLLHFRLGSLYRLT